MRASVVLACVSAFACLVLVAAQLPLVPESASATTPRERFYLQTAAGTSNASGAFGTFGSFVQVANYLDASFYQAAYTGPNGPATLPNAGTATGVTLAVFTNSSRDILGARQTDPANPTFPSNSVLPADFPTRRSQAAIAQAVTGTNPNGTRRVDANGAQILPERLARVAVTPSLQNGFEDYIGQTSFTPRSEFASTTFGQIIWVLGGFDASFYNRRTSIPQAALNDVHISLDSGSTWAQMTDAEEDATDATLITPLHWSVRNGNVAVAYKYEYPMRAGVPAYFPPCPSEAYDEQTGAATGTGQVPVAGSQAFFGPSPVTGIAGCTARVGETVNNVQDNVVKVQTAPAGLITYGAAYTGNPTVSGNVPYPSGRAQPILPDTPIAAATGLNSGYVALLMTGGSAGSSTVAGSAVSDAWLSLDFGTSWTLQCFTLEPQNYNGPAGSSVIPADNDNNNSPEDYAQNLNFQFSPTGPAGYFPAGVAGCGFQARVHHTMVTVPGVGCANGVCVTNPPMALLMGGFNAYSNSLNDVWRTMDNGQTWTQMNGCDYLNRAIIPGSSPATQIRKRCNLQYQQGRAGPSQQLDAVQFTSGAVSTGYPIIWSARNQFAAALVVVTSAGTNAGGTNAPLPIVAGATPVPNSNSGVFPFNRVVVAGGFSGTANDQNDVWVSDDVFVKGGVQAAFANYLNPACVVNATSATVAVCGVADVPPPRGPAQAPAYGVYEFNLYGRWTKLLDSNTAYWRPRRGHGMAFLACLGQLFLIGGDYSLEGSDSNLAGAIVSLNDVWYSSDSGFSWLQLRENGQDGTFPKRDLFGVLTTTTSIVVLGGEILASISGGGDKRIADNLPVEINNGVPFYGDVWASAFAEYTYGPYGPCQCNSGATPASSFGFQRRAYACASGSPNTAGCCQGAPIVTTRCSCYTWSNPYFTVDRLNATLTNQRIQYSNVNTDRGSVASQCQAGSKCDVYPDITYLYASADCYDRTGYNTKNYTIFADQSTAAQFQNELNNALPGALSAFVAPGESLTVGGAAVNDAQFPVHRFQRPYASYQYAARVPTGTTLSQYSDVRDNPCDGYFSQFREQTVLSPLPGSSDTLATGSTLANSNAIRNLYNASVFDAVTVFDPTRASTTVPFNFGNPADVDARLYADAVSKEGFAYNNLGLARAYYMQSVDLEVNQIAYLTGALTTYNQYFGFYFTPLRQPQLIFPCNRPTCRFCQYTAPTYLDCSASCNSGTRPLDVASANAVRCEDRTFGANTVAAPFRLVPTVTVAPGGNGFGDVSQGASCCSAQFNPNAIDFNTGRSAVLAGVNPYTVQPVTDGPSPTTGFFFNVQYPATEIPCFETPCPTHVLGDPEFLGFQGQKYEIHGIPDQVFNIISSPFVQYNARFVYIGHKSQNQCDKTRTHPWTHAGTYLGELGFKTAGGDSIVMQSGACNKGIQSVTVNGKPLKAGHKVSLKHQVAKSGVHQSIAMTDAFNVVLQLAEFDITLTNSDHFFNQEVSMTAYGEELLLSHGLLGQTWKNETYTVDGIKRVIEGVPTDYLIADEDLLGDSFTYNKFNL